MRTSDKQHTLIADLTTETLAQFVPNSKCSLPHADAIEWYVKLEAANIDYGVRVLKNSRNWQERFSLAGNPLDTATSIFANIARETHFLHANALNWGFPLFETQITRGLANFLNAGYSREVRLQRCKLMAKALSSFASPINESFIAAIESAEDAYCGSEYGDKSGRVDLFLWFFTDIARSKSTCAVAMECKMSADLNVGQLAKYNRVFKKKRLHEAGYEPKYNSPPSSAIQKYLIVKSESAIGKHHRRNSSWAIVPWATLLIAYEREIEEQLMSGKKLNVGSDDHEFRQYMKVVFELAEGRLV